jgi:2-(1,2-epoxy-1,2-dihydrophenyl)acetyl-CoA isomerase
MIEALDRVQLPVVAGVRGWAAGIGNMLALSADVVIAAPSAKFWVPFVLKGFTPDSGNTWLLPRLVGLARAKEMVLRGMPVSGEKAAAWGLVSECVGEEELDAAVMAVADELASAATVSVGLAKILLHRNLEVTLAAALQNEAVYEELAVRSDDFKEGMRSFSERRPPKYTGW